MKCLVDIKTPSDQATEDCFQGPLDDGDGTPSTQPGLPGCYKRLFVKIGECNLLNDSFAFTVWTYAMWFFVCTLSWAPQIRGEPGLEVAFCVSEHTKHKNWKYFLVMIYISLLIYVLCVTTNSLMFYTSSYYFLVFVDSCLSTYSHGHNEGNHC